VFREDGGKEKRRKLHFYASITWISFSGLRRSAPNSQPSSSRKAKRPVGSPSVARLGRLDGRVKRAGLQIWED
jgi:hypothetical protein